MTNMYAAFLQLGILWSAARGVATATEAPERGKLSVSYIVDKPLTDKEKISLAHFERRLSGNEVLSGHVSISRHILPNNRTTMLDTLRALDAHDNWNATKIVITSFDNVAARNLTTGGHRTLVFDIRRRPRDLDKVYYNMFVAKPSLARLHEAVEAIFGEIGYTKMHEVECLSQQSADIAKTKETLETIKTSVHSFVFVKCLDNLELVLRQARDLSLLTSEFRWVFPGVLSLRDISDILPQNVIAIDLPGSADQFQTIGVKNTYFLDDTLGVLEKSIEKTFEELSTENEWDDRRLFNKLKRHIVRGRYSGQTGEVIFNGRGQRFGETYKIFELITFNGVHQWLPIGSLEKGNVTILFNQWRLEDKTPDTPVLRVVTRLKPPYLMYGSVQKPSSVTGMCELGRVCRYFAAENDDRPTVNGSHASGNESRPTAHEDYCCTGLLVEFLERLEFNTGFNSRIHLVKDGMFGSNDPKTKLWNGMIGELLRDEADMAVSTLTITAKRSKVVDFTYPYVDIANAILVSTKPVSHDMWDFVFLDTFSASLWLALLIAIQIVIVLLWFAERLRKRRRFLNFPHKRDNSISCAQIISYTWSLMFQKASEEIGPNTLGGRTVAALFAFCTIVVCSSFTANLAAIKVTTKEGISISGIRDTKFQNGEIVFGTLANSANLDFFRDSTDPLFQSLYKRMKDNVVTSYSDGAQMVISRKWEAFIADAPQLAYLVSNQTDCGLKIAGDPFFFSGYGIALQKNSTWNTKLSLVITSLVRKGYVASLQAKWLASGCGDVKQPGIEKMGVNDVGGAFVIVSFGCVASGAFLLLEHVVWYVLNRKEMLQGNQGGKRSVDHAVGALVKLFNIWDIRSSARQQHPTAAMLQTFKSLERNENIQRINIYASES